MSLCPTHEGVEMNKSFYRGENDQNGFCHDMSLTHLFARTKCLWEKAMEKTKGGSAMVCIYTCYEIKKKHFFVVHPVTRTICFTKGASTKLGRQTRARRNDISINSVDWIKRMYVLKMPIETESIPAAYVYEES